MQLQEQQRFRGPVPGQAMTAGEKSRPWFNPPKFNTVEEGMEFYLDTLSTQEQSTKLFSVIRTGIPITTITETITTGGVMEGYHTIDVALLLNPIIVEFIKGMCDVAGVEYTLDSTIPEEDKVNMTAFREVIKEQLDESGQSIQAAGEQTKEVKPKGLMAKRETE
tara:strand:+ start:4166 stop:4660 length:495 start_codon:yes stop_codon:yes gene_type:complete